MRAGGAIAFTSGVGVPTLNGVWPERADPDPGAVAGLLDQVSDTGLPYCMQLRPGASRELAGLAAARMMSPEEEIPLMVLEDPAAIRRARSPTALPPARLGSWLQSSPPGYATYVRLGFQMVETWQCWVAMNSVHAAS